VVTDGDGGIAPPFMEVNDQLYTPDTLPLEKNPPVRTGGGGGGCVGPITGLDAAENENLFSLPEIKTPRPARPGRKLVATPTELSRLPERK
jgi:hypothetical protein